MATDYATLIAAARTECADTFGSNPIFAETPDGVRDGTNRLFRLRNTNVVPVGTSGGTYDPKITYGSTQVRVALAAMTSPGPVTIDVLSGYLTFTSAPDANVTNPFVIDYYYQFYLDGDYQTWIDQAGEELGFLPGQIPATTNLYPALVQYVIERFWTRRAADYARKFGGSGGSLSESGQQVYDNYLKLAELAGGKAEKMRIHGYVDPGAAIQPASGTITYGISPYTPRR